MYKLQYFDAEGDVCEKDFNSSQELESFANSLPVGYVIGILIPDDVFASEVQDCLNDEMEYQLMSQFFPPNKVN